MTDRHNDLSREFEGMQAPPRRARRLIAEIGQVAESDMRSTSGFSRRRSAWPGQTQRDSIFRYICYVCREQSGISPTVPEIAEEFDLHRTTIMSHLRKLERDGRIAWIGKAPHTRIMVQRSHWEEPNDAEV